MGNRTPNDTNVRAAVGLPLPKEFVIEGTSPPNTLPSSIPTVVVPIPNDPPTNAVFRVAVKSVLSPRGLRVEIGGRVVTLTSNASRDAESPEPFRYREPQPGGLYPGVAQRQRDGLAALDR